MAVAFDNFGSTDNASATSQPFSAPVTLAAGSISYMGIRTNSDTNIVTGVTDDKSGVWSLVSFDDNNGIGNSLVTYKCASCPGGATTPTIALSTGSGLRAAVVSYTGASGDEGTIHNSNTGTNLATTASGTITTLGANRVLVGIACPAVATTTITPNSGETGRGSVATGRMQIEDIAAATATGYTLSWAFSAPSGNNAVAYFVTALIPSTAAAKFRKFLSSLGTRIGARQLQAT
jgi:hypothetical protein